MFLSACMIYEPMKPIVTHVTLIRLISWMFLLIKITIKMSYLIIRIISKCHNSNIGIVYFKDILNLMNHRTVFQNEYYTLILLICLQI